MWSGEPLTFWWRPAGFDILQIRVYSVDNGIGILFWFDEKEIWNDNIKNAGYDANSACTIQVMLFYGIIKKNKNLYL